MGREGSLDEVITLGQNRLGFASGSITGALLVGECQITNNKRDKCSVKEYKIHLIKNRTNHRTKKRSLNVVVHYLLRTDTCVSLHSSLSSREHTSIHTLPMPAIIITVFFFCQYK
jgi:hypothetical protein